MFKESQHDAGDKTVFGKKGKFHGNDIVALCLDHKAAPAFIAGKLYRFLVSESVPATPELLEPLAEQFRKSDYDFGALVKTVLRSNLFFSQTVYRTRVKAPVDFLLGIARPFLPERRPGTTALGDALEDLGQSLFYPPSVKGWDGGRTWLDGHTLLARQNMALALTSTEDLRFSRRTDPDPAALAEKHHKKTDKELAELFLYVYLQGDVPAEKRAKLLDYLKRAQKQTMPVYYTDEDRAKHRVRALCHLVLTLPEFQLD
jgi:uncharacterized protein (DUF1800 family)